MAHNKFIYLHDGKFTLVLGAKETKSVYESEVGTLDGERACRINLHPIKNDEKYNYGDKVAKEDISEEVIGTILIRSKTTLKVLNRHIEWLIKHFDDEKKEE